jgi:hypothetical protein
VFAVIALMFLVSFTLAAATLLRRPGIAPPGLLGGLLVTLAWLALSGFTFYGSTASSPRWVRSWHRTAYLLLLCAVAAAALVLAAASWLRG